MFNRIVVSAIISLSMMVHISDVKAATYDGLDHLNRIIINTPGVSTVGTSSGVTANAVGDVVVTTSKGLKIPVPTTAAANISKSAIAGAARAAARLLGPIGIAATAYSIYKEIKESGVQTCSHPDFFCMPLSDAESKPGIYKDQYPDCYSAVGTQPGGNPTDCKYLQQTYPQGIWVRNADLETDNGCKLKGIASWFYTARVYDCSLSTTKPPICSTGTIYNATTRKCETTSPILKPITDENLEQVLQDKMNADPTLSKKLYDAIRSDEQEKRYDVPESTLISPTTPVTITSPTVVSPKVITKTEVIQKSDGSLDTVKTEESTTVSPTVTGTTLGDSKVSYPTTTNITTTTTNNVTNLSTSNTTTVNEPNALPEQKPIEIPKDYAKDATVQKIADALDTTSAPMLPDQETRVTNSFTKNTSDIAQLQNDAKNGYADKSTWFSWIWTPPIGTCAPFSGQVGLYAISWDICPTVANIRDVLGWLFALLAAMDIYGQLFRRNDGC